MTASQFHLTMPAQTAHLQLVRLNVAALASDVLSVDEIEDVKVAVEELSAVLMRPDGEADLHLAFVVSSDSIGVSGRRELGPDQDVVAHEFLSTILDAVCDDHELGTDAGVGRFRFVKNARD